MKKILKNRIAIAALCTVTAFAAVSCDDWTEVESLDIHQPTIEEQNPELYAKYLESLREYKTSDHKILYATFDNSAETATTRAQHLTVVPDSVDIISLNTPDNMPEWLAEEVAAVRRDKGTKVIYTISYQAMEAEWKAMQEAAAEEGGSEGEGEGEQEPVAPENDPFALFVAQKTAEAVAYCGAHGYDGLTAAYIGTQPEFVVEGDKELFAARQNAFMNAIKGWVESNPDKMFIFEGMPQNLIDKSILSSADYIILNTLSASSVEYLSVAAVLASSEGVPTDRFIYAVETVTFDPSDDKTGYYGSARALPLAAQYVASTGSVNKSGLAIRNVHRDYYNTTLIYKYTREAISTMNPSPKN